MPELFEARRQAEQALLGALLIEGACQNTQAISDVKKILSPQDFLDTPFYKGLHGRIFEAMTHLEFPHQIAVAEELNNTGKLMKGDCAYLVGLVADCPCSVAYMDFAQTILNYSSGKKKPQYKDGI